MGDLRKANTKSENRVLVIHGSRFLPLEKLKGVACFDQFAGIKALRSDFAQ
jgi:hypothetical protein